MTAALGLLLLLAAKTAGVALDIVAPQTSLLLVRVVLLALFSRLRLSLFHILGRRADQAARAQLPSSGRARAGRAQQAPTARQAVVGLDYRSFLYLFLGGPIVAPS